MENIPFEERVARVAHASNREYCASIGDDSQPDWEHAPQWQRESAIDGVLFHLIAHKDGVQLDPSDSHKNWLAKKASEGWKYGPVKDPGKKEHPCFVPYMELPVGATNEGFSVCGGLQSIC
mgnify:CR=1 FL=1